MSGNAGSGWVACGIVGPPCYESDSHAAQLRRRCLPCANLYALPWLQLAAQDGVYGFSPPTQLELLAQFMVSLQYKSYAVVLVRISPYCRDCFPFCLLPASEGWDRTIGNLMPRLAGRQLDQGAMRK
jgi:hypothetical protein